MSQSARWAGPSPAPGIEPGKARVNLNGLTGRAATTVAVHMDYVSNGLAEEEAYPNPSAEAGQAGASQARGSHAAVPRLTTDRELDRSVSSAG